MISKRCALELEAFEYPSFPRQESWEDFIQFRSERMIRPPSPDAEFSEIVYEKQPEFFEKMEEEDNLSTNGELSLKKFIEGIEFSEAAMKREEGMTEQNERGNLEEEEDGTDCSRCHSEEEEVGSISTRDSLLEFTTMENDTTTFNFDDNSLIEQSFDLESEMKTKVMEFMHTRSAEEKEYIRKIMPNLISSAKEVYRLNHLPLTDEIIISIIKNLLFGKEAMMETERQMLKKIVKTEMIDLKDLRPESKVKDDFLSMQKRKEKKASKGNKNSSTLNHFNENYVSNIFQFAKRNFPGDREIQKIGNSRNVSASNFRNLMKPKLTDDIMIRKAKARIHESGSELVGNIEYWMRDGYFEQCADREKYIWHKEKALRDLALTGQY